MKRSSSILMITLALSATLSCPSCRTKTQTAIPLTLWLPKGSSSLGDHYRIYYTRALEGRGTEGRSSNVLTQGVKALPALFSEVQNTSLDGERSEKLSKDLVFALIVLGDRPFASEFSKQTPDRRRILALRISNNLGGLGSDIIPETINQCSRNL